METNVPLGPPELPGAKTPQLIASTRPVAPALAPDAQEDDAVEPDELNEHVEEPGDPDGVIAADEERKWREHQAAPEPLGAAKTKRKRHWPLRLFILLVIIAAAVGAFWYGDHKAAAPAAKQPQTSTTQQQTTQPAATVSTKHYNSTAYTLDFDYPETWTVADTTAKLTVISPAIQLTTQAGSKTSGHVVVTIQNQQTTIAGYPANGATASLESDKLTYKQPTAVQRAQTYLSYLGYQQATGLDALYITGDNGYQAGQSVPLSDVVKGNPLVSVTFQTCASADCSSGTPSPITLLASSWAATQASKDVTALLQSIQLN